MFQTSVKFSDVVFKVVCNAHLPYWIYLREYEHKSGHGLFGTMDAVNSTALISCCQNLLWYGMNRPSMIIVSNDKVREY